VIVESKKVTPDAVTPCLRGQVGTIKLEKQKASKKKGECL